MVMGGHALTGVLVETANALISSMSLSRHALTGVLVETLSCTITYIQQAVTPSRAC